MTQQPPPASTQQPPEEARPLADQLKLIGAGTAALALILFFLQNLQKAEINFLWFEWHIAVIWALLASSILGALAVLFVSTLRRWRGSRTPRKRD